MNNMLLHRRPARSASVALALTLLSGCASVQADRGFANVSNLVEPHVGQRPAWIRTAQERTELQRTLDDLRAKPLGVDEATSYALLNNRSLQSAYAELGLVAAEVAQASRLPNPGFAYKRLSGSGGDLEIERQFSLNVLGVLTLPIAASIERRRFDQGQLRAANEVVAFVADVRKAWYRAVAAQQAAAYAEQVREAAELRAEFARRLRAAGNWSALDQARQHALYAEIVARVARARLVAASERERLARLLGAWGEGLAFTLPDKLPDLPGEPREFGELEAQAIADRFDLRMGKAELEGLARALGLTSATRFVNVLEASYFRNTNSGQSRQTGYEISLEIPLFDWGDAKVARAEYTYMQAADRLAALAVKARSEVRESYLAYRTSYDVAKHFRDEVLPLRRHIAEEVTLRFNGMLISVFELLADTREQIASVIAALEAQREFWIAETTLRFVAVADMGDTGREMPSLGLSLSSD